MLYLIVLLIVLKFFPYENVRQMYLRYKSKRLLKVLLGNVDPHLLTLRRQKIHDAFKTIPIVNLFEENIEDAEELLKVRISPVKFNKDLIDIETVFLQKTFPDDAKNSIEQCRAWESIPLTIRYEFKSYHPDEFQQELEDISKRKYFSLDEFIISDTISFSFVKDLLEKRIVLWGMYYRKITSTEMIIMLIPFQKQSDNSEHYTTIPLSSKPLYN